MATQEWIETFRDVKAVKIPSGETTILLKGTHVQITQEVGGSFTLLTHDGNMVRLEGTDADALGRSVPEEGKQEVHGLSKEEIEKVVLSKLKSCYDPEIPVNIIELGLVYVCRVNPLSEEEYDIDIKFTLTAPGCGMGDILKREIEEKMSKIKGVKTVQVEIVMEPPWDKSMMSQAAKLQLGIFD